MAKSANALSIRQFLVIIVFLFTCTAFGQTPVDSVFMRGAAALQGEKWAEAAAAFEQVVKRDTSNTQAAFMLGQAYYLMKDYRKAAATWEKVATKDYRPQTVRYNLASTYAKLRDNERAFTWLAQALEAGFSRADVLQTDSVFAALWSDERFEKVLELADANARPCEHDPTYRILDFWLGDWEVYVNDSLLIGSSRIEKLVNGCALQEQFAQHDGFVGTNLFYFNNITGEWKMIWVTGAAVALGGLKEKVMTARSERGVRFIGELPDQEGGVILDRSTISPRDADRVDMTIEQSRDGGDNWVTTFAGHYQRVKR